jgi:hypothetical protein
MAARALDSRANGATATKILETVRVRCNGEKGDIIRFSCVAESQFCPFEQNERPAGLR